DRPPRLDARGASGRVLRSWSEESADDGVGAFPLPFDFLHPAIRVNLGSRRDGVRHIRQRRRLLRVDRAAHSAIAGAQALTHVAARGVDLPSQLAAAVVDGAVVGIGVLGIDLLNPESALYFLEVRAEHLRGQRQPLGAAPVLEDAIWSAVAGGPVHDGAAADRAPL